MDTDNNLMMTRRSKDEGWVEVAKGKMGTFVIASTIKIKKKYKIETRNVNVIFRSSSGYCHHLPTWPWAHNLMIMTLSNHPAVSSLDHVSTNLDFLQKCSFIELKQICYVC